MHKDNSIYSILIVDDNPGDVMLISDYLEEEIVIPKLEIANNYHQSRELLLDRNHHFDVILLDLTLPDLSGEELVKEIVSIAHNVSVIVLTGYSDFSFGKKCLTWGASDYLMKDNLHPTVLYKSIVFAIERNEYVNQIKDSQKRYFDLFQLSPQPMWVCDFVNLKFLDVNNATVQLYGFSKDEFLNMSISDIVPSNEVLNYQTEPTMNNEVRQILHCKKGGGEIIVEERSNIINYNGKKARIVLAIDVTENRKLQEELDVNTYLVENRERRRISSNLHDGLQQTILASYMRFENVKNNFSEIHQEKFAERFLGGFELLKEALEQTRTVAHRLVPVQIEKEGVVFAIEDLISKNSFLNINFNFVENIGEERLALNLEILLYSIAQECVNNIIKHAQASNVNFHLFKEDSSVHLIITDDGIGFDPSSSVSSSFGLLSIKGRVGLLAGIFIIKSELGKGASLEVILPLSSGYQLTV
ncbi:MAG: PAS domain S-box-containing protein [Arcticibacterium sp.]|jgi:PAS domain S-box-containing protein